MVKETKANQAWRWCCQQKQFTTPQMRDALEMSARWSHHIMRRWVKIGVIEQVGDTYPATYRVMDMERNPATGSGNYPRKRTWRKTQRQKMWNAMKISQAFTLADLVMTSDVMSCNACAYVNRLVSSGYVKITGYLPRSDGQSGHDKPRYLLIRDTGRFAPMVRRDGVWDQNEQKLYPLDGGSYERVA